MKAGGVGIRSGILLSKKVIQELHQRSDTHEHCHLLETEVTPNLGRSEPLTPRHHIQLPTPSSWLIIYPLTAKTKPPEPKWRVWFSSECTHQRVVLPQLIAFQMMTLEHHDGAIQLGHVQTQIICADFFIGSIGENLEEEKQRRYTTYTSNLALFYFTDQYYHYVWVIIDFI